MAQIIKHRRGSLEALSAVTSSLQKGELVIASGSSNLSVTNGASIVFAVPENGQVQAVNRFLVGANAPSTFAAGTYNGMVKGVPYYASGSSTLYLLGEGANDIPDLTGNISNFSSSVASSINALSASIGSGAIGTSVTQLNTFSGSTLVSLGALNSFSSSQLTQNSTLATYTGSVETRLTEIGVVSGSLIASASAAKTTNDSQGVSITNLNTFSGSQLTQNSTLATYTGSVETRLTEIGVVSGSLISSASAAAIANVNQNTFTASVETRLTEVGVVTGSLISSASTVLTRFNAFSSSFDTAFDISGTNVTIAGNLTVAGTQTIVDSTTVQIGDNIIELNGSGAANGGLYVKDATIPNTATGSLLWDSTNDYWKAGVKDSESKVLLAGGDSVVSGSSQITLQSTTGFTAYDTALSTITGSLITSASAAKTTNDSQGVSITNLNTTSASVNTSIAALNSYTSSNTSTNALNAYTASAETRFTEIGVVSGSLIASASAAKTTNDSQGVSITNLNTFSASVNTSVTALNSSSASQQVSIDTLNSFSGSQLTQNTALATVSGSLISSASAANISITNLNTFSGSQLTQNSTLATYTASVDTRLTEIGVVSGSLISSASAASVSITNLNSKSASVDTSISNINTFTSSFGTTFSSSVDSRLDTLEGTGTIQGVGTSNNVTFAKVTTTGDVVVGGDLVVQGNTVTLNTATLVVEDKLITLASGSTSSATADGAGFEVAGANANFVYQHSTTAFTSSVALIAPAVTASFNLGSAAGSSKRVAFRNTNGNLDLVPTASVAGDLLQWDGTDFVMSNVIDGGSF
jgi:acyl-coenzyme A thioesterase PaaI-like protein